MEKRYLLDNVRLQQVRSVLARYFEGVELSVRVVLELIWQYREAGNDERLMSVMLRPEVVMLLSEGENQWELLETWSGLARRGQDVEASYRTSLAVWRSGKSTAERAEVLGSVGWLLESLGRWGMATEVFEELVVLGEEANDRAWEMEGHHGVGGYTDCAVKDC